MAILPKKVAKRNNSGPVKPGTSQKSKEYAAPKENAINLSFESWKLAKMIAAGYTIRAAKKQLGIKPGVGIWKNSKTEKVVAELLNKAIDAVQDEIFRQLGWED